MLNGKRIGFAVTASFCTVLSILDSMRSLRKSGAELFPIVSDNVYSLSSRFHDKTNFLFDIEQITGRAPVHTVAEAETFGPDNPLDILVIAPVTGTTLAKLAYGINDNAVLMTAKATLRNGSPLVLAPFTNDALGASGMNIMKLLNTKNIFFVPFGQDNPAKKPTSMTADLSLLEDTITCALEGKQRQPVIISH